MPNVSEGINTSNDYFEIGDYYFVSWPDSPVGPCNWVADGPYLVYPDDISFINEERGSSTFRTKEEAEKKAKWYNDFNKGLV